MSKENIADNISDEQRAENLVSQLKDGLEQAQGYLLGELVKIGQADENNKIDVNDPKVQQVIKTFISAEPDNNEDLTKPTRSVLSINATIQDGKKKIAKWIAGTKDTPPIEAKYFDAIKKEMDELFSKVEGNLSLGEEDKWSSKIKDQLSTQEGIDNAIKNRIKDNFVLQPVGLAKLKNGQFTFLASDEKKLTLEKIGQNLEIPSGVISTTLQDARLIGPLNIMIKDRAVECFGETVQSIPGVGLIDEKKLELKENIDKFTKLVNHDMKAFAAIQENLNPEISVEKNKEITSVLLLSISKLKPEEIQEKGAEIVKNFAPLLESKNEKLAKVTEVLLKNSDPVFLANNSKGIAEKLEQATKTNLWEKIQTKIFRQDVVGKKLAKFESFYKVENENFIKAAQASQANQKVSQQPKPPMQESFKDLSESKKPSITPPRSSNNEGRGL